MKRRRRGGAAPQAEACDVWLDTAELKQSAMQSLTAKPKGSNRVLERKHASVTFMQPRASQPRTKQTTISSFFSTQTDEKDKENSRPSPFIPNKDKGVSVAASPVKISALLQLEAPEQSLGAQEGTLQVTQRAPASPTPSPDPLSSQAESHSEREASCGVGEDCCSLSFTQDSEGNRVIAHRNESRLFAGEKLPLSQTLTSDHGVNAGLHPGEAKTGLDFHPRLSVNQSKKPQQPRRINSLIDFTETENINPTRSGSARPLRERSQNAGAGEGWGGETGRGSPCGHLFTQDSQGNRVIAHRCRGAPSPRRARGSSGRQLLGAASEGSSSHAMTRGWSDAGEQQFEVCYKLLFTQDSEGNRVIKHW
ncbi:aurora kinase A- and ninein-interacting protein [Podargus strigoides]